MVKNQGTKKGKQVKPKNNVLQGEEEKKPTVRFSVEMSIDLLTEVIRQNPYKEVNQIPTWMSIAQAVTTQWDNPLKVLSFRTARSHTNTTLQNYKKWKASSKKQSGISEEKSLRNDRCEEILQLQDEAKRTLQAKLQEQTKKELKAQKKKETEGKMLRDAALKTLGGDDSASEDEGDKGEDDDDDGEGSDVEPDETKKPKKKRQRVTKMQVNMSVLDLLSARMKSISENEAKKLENEARIIALREREMALKEGESKKGGRQVDAMPSTSKQQDTVIQAAGPGGEPRLLTQLQPASFSFSDDPYPFKLSL